MRVSRGFHETERARAAELYWEAFAPKLGPILGPADRARDYLALSFDPEHALCARSPEGLPATPINCLGLLQV